MNETISAIGSPVSPAHIDDAAIVAGLDIAYQAAVKRNDADTMDTS